ncbi:post-GPI attachment to proteins factor 3 [Nasonia vitripennis]|uniref:Post-GPI attachment to proteins factor 3 n=1 Tax=Nasonia vitripennis TaxID=7425 RepID=A0A7M7G8F4_NASVI|nr:post-GPI attachment to proteins factor 3 [Nasonia vitripennis]
MTTIWLLIITLISFSTTVKASIGDRSQFYSNCINNCRKDRCINAVEFKENPPLNLRLLHWTCKEDCSYSCMWETVHFFTSRGLHVPQFHGKWPFIRMIGLQEPASVIFSILNFYAHATYYLKFKKEVSSSSPMFFIWTWFTAICLHGWFWSAVFHARDKDFTEVMDYSCAFAIVLTLLYCLLLRLSCRDGIGSKVFTLITGIYLAVLYSHLTHLWSGRINYGYNMKFNIVVGFLTFIITMIWWYRNHERLPHVHLVGWFTVLTVSVTLLEVADFPPIFWIFDAHSLWHASTVPLVNLLYRFIIMDCQYLKRQYLKLEADRL